MSSDLGTCFFWGRWVRLLSRPHIWTVATTSCFPFSPPPAPTLGPPSSTPASRDICIKLVSFSAPPRFKSYRASCCPKERKQALPVSTLPQGTCSPHPSLLQLELLPRSKFSISPVCRALPRPRPSLTLCLSPLGLPVTSVSSTPFRAQPEQTSSEKSGQNMSG